MGFWKCFLLLYVSLYDQHPVNHLTIFNHAGFIWYQDGRRVTPSCPGVGTKALFFIYFSCRNMVVNLPLGLMVESFLQQPFVRGVNRRLMQEMGGSIWFFSLLLFGGVYLLISSLLHICFWVFMFFGFRLWRFVQAEMQSSLEAKRVQQGVWHLLCEVQVCATGNRWEQRDVWGVLHWNDHPWEQDQMSIAIAPKIPPV